MSFKAVILLGFLSACLALPQGPAATVNAKVDQRVSVPQAVRLMAILTKAAGPKGVRALTKAAAEDIRSLLRVVIADLVSQLRNALLNRVDTGARKILGEVTVDVIRESYVEFLNKLQAILDLQEFNAAA